MAPIWDSADAAWLRSQLNTPSGKKLLELWKARIPRIKSMAKESAWIQAVIKQGHEEMLEIFLMFAEHGEPQLREGEDFRDMSLEGD